MGKNLFGDFLSNATTAFKKRYEAKNEEVDFENYQDDIELNLMEFSSQDKTVDWANKVIYFFNEQNKIKSNTFSKVRSYSSFVNLHKEALKVLEDEKLRKEREKKLLEDLKNEKIRKEELEFLNKAKSIDEQINTLQYVKVEKQWCESVFKLFSKVLGLEQKVKAKAENLPKLDLLVGIANKVKEALIVNEKIENLYNENNKDLVWCKKVFELNRKLYQKEYVDTFKLEIIVNEAKILNENLIEDIEEKIVTDMRQNVKIQQEEDSKKKETETLNKRINEFVGFVKNNRSRDLNGFQYKIPYSFEKSDIRISLERVEDKKIKKLVVPFGTEGIESGVLKKGNKILEISLPQTILKIKDFAFQNGTNIENVNVDLKNENYISFEGNIYSKDMTTLIYYCQGKKDKKLILPKEVISINMGAFVDVKNLEEVIGENVEIVKECAFLGCNKLQKISFPKCNLKQDMICKCKKIKL